MIMTMDDIRRGALLRWGMGVALLLTLAACDAAKTPDPAPADTAARGISTPAPAPSSAPTVRAVDTADGTIVVTGSGAASGTWKFDDANAVIEETARGGESQSVLTIEAHDGINGRHLRLRLIRVGETIDAGTYTIGATSDRRLDARWEGPTMAYRSLDGARGSVTLKSLENNHAVGTFNVTLPSIEDANAVQQVQGSFNQLVQR